MTFPLLCELDLKIKKLHYEKTPIFTYSKNYSVLNDNKSVICFVTNITKFVLGSDVDESSVTFYQKNIAQKYEFYEGNLYSSCILNISKMNVNLKVKLEVK